ncbi:MAG: hypothetical protein AAF914_12115 [Pseudomonadota bacterium]
MQILPPVISFAPQTPERQTIVPPVKAPAPVGGGDLDSDTGDPATPHDPALASERAREIGRIVFATMNPDADEDGLQPLDTRTVGDQDIIDPDRPPVRRPDPMVTLGDGLTEAEASATVPETDDAAEHQELPQALQDKDEDTPPVQTPERLGPPAPGAVSPDVPEPPLPGAVDIKR